MAKMVRARYLGGMTVDVLLDDGTSLTVEPRHVYEVPEAMVKDHPEWKVQPERDEPERVVHTQEAETAVEAVHEHKNEPRETAVDRSPRENG